MPYWLESDTFHSDGVWEVLAGGRPDRIDTFQAAYCRLKSAASHQRRDGYLTEQQALAECRGRRQVLERLCTPVLDRKPLLHRPGDECECLGDVWIDGYAYRIHEFLKRNPSRREHDRNEAQKRDLRDARLKALVYARDGGCCRYCRSGPLSPKAGKSKDRRKVLMHDHVDPDQPAGVDGENFVISCGRCNESKGRCTPAEADMVLLPPPSPEEAAAWRARPQQLHDRPPHVPGSPQNQPPITDESPSDQRSDQKPVSDPITDPRGDPTGDPIDDSRPQARPDQATDDINQHTDQASGGSGLGRGGQPDGDPAAGRGGQPIRTPAYPDIYHRRSRSAGPSPPLPEYVWPPGSTPTRPPPAASVDRPPRPEEHP